MMPSITRVTADTYRHATGVWFAIVLCVGLLVPSTAGAINLIEVESKTVVAGATNVPIHIRIVNEDSLEYLSIPLELRSVDGAFIDWIWVQNSERITPDVFTQFPRTERYAEPSLDPCPYQVSEPFSTGLSVAGPPEGVLLIRQGCGTCDDYLTPGVDVEGSFLMLVDVGPATGTFEIDTTCADGNHLFALGEGGTPNLVFNKGVITVVASAPDTLYVDTTGSDVTGNGSQLNPLRTIQYAIDSLSGVGSTPSYIIVGPGNYDGPIVYPTNISLSIKSQAGPFLTHIVGDTTNTPGTPSAVLMSAASPTDELVLDGFTVRDNKCSAANSGGGVTVDLNTKGTILNCIIEHNSATDGAGGLDYKGEGGTVANNWIVHNRFTQSGIGYGGVYIIGSAELEFVNNTVVGNSSVTPVVSTSGIFLDATPMASSRFADQFKDLDRSSVTTADANDAVLVFDNNIIAYNRPSYGFASAIPPSATFFNCLYYGNGQGNSLNGAPFDPVTLVVDSARFVDTTAHDYHLACESPAINAGRDISVPPGLLVDIDGQPRFGPAASPVDIGADEFFDDHKVAQFTATPVIGCAPLDVTFSNQSTFCFDEGMKWQFGDGGSALNIFNPQHTYTTPGTYSVTLIVAGQDDADTLTLTDYITVLESPVVDFAADTLQGCGVLVVSFEATTESVVDQFKWYFGDGDSAIGNPVLHQYDDPGIFDVELQSSNICGVDTVLKENYIELASPFAMDFSASDYFECDSLTTQFSALVSSPVQQFYWDFGDPLSPDPIDDSGQVVTHTFRQPGKYTITLWAGNICEIDTVRKAEYVTVGGPPHVFITSSHDTTTGSTCNPYAVAFSYTSTQPPSSFLWEFGDNTTSTEATPTHTYLEGGRTYSVRLTVTGTCGGDVAVRSNYITVTKRPTATLTADTTVVCAGSLPVTLNASIDGTASNAEWHCGDGTVIPGPIAQHTYAQIGTYAPFFIMTHQCGTDTTYLADTITVAAPPTAAFTANPHTGYVPQAVTFTDQSQNVPISWVWDFGDGDVSTQASPTHVYDLPGVYTVRQAIENPCGADTVEQVGLIQVGGFLVGIDSLGGDVDTITYTVDVDTSVLAYDHDVTLTGSLTPTPTRGGMVFGFNTSAAQPPYSTTMSAVPTGGLPSGSYTIKVTATDPVRIARTATIPLNFAGQQLLSPSVTTLIMDSTIVTTSSSKVFTLRNTAKVGSGLFVTVLNPQLSGAAFSIQGSGATLAPQQKLEWPILFTPLRKGNFTGELRISSDDPARPLLTIPLSGKGIGEQVPPTLVSRTSTELVIDKPIVFEFSEAMVPNTADTVLTVRDKAGDALAGVRTWPTNKKLQFAATSFFPPDDTLAVTLRGIVTDTNGNFLDGNGNGQEDKSPVDDIVFTLPTGPGVYPGDADNDGSVNERDVLALGRFYGLSGPPRTNSQPGFSLQPASAWSLRAATYADADGSGDVDSMDICPIAEFFDREVSLPKSVVDAWLADVSAGSSELISSLINALNACPSSGTGHVTLQRFLSEMQGPAAVPQSYALGQNYPNPFNPSTLIRYSLSEPTDLRLEVFDVLGRRIRVLEQTHREAGVYHVVWDGLDAEGRQVASGIYFYRLSAPRFHATRKMVLLR